MAKRHYVLLLVCCVVACVLPASGGVDSVGVWSQDLLNSARVYSMDISATNNNLIYCAGLDSGVYKSTNAGASWVAVNNGLTYNHVQVIAMSQSNNNILYCGTDQLGTTNSGVYKSTDGGASWTAMNTGIIETSRGIQAIAVHPTNPNIAWMSVFDGLVNSTTGLYKTTDGTTWVPSNNGIGTIKNFLSIAVNPMNPNTLYAGTSFSVVAPTLSSRIYKSIDGGANWVNISSGLPTDTTIGHPVRALSISTVDTNVVLAAMFLASDTLGGMYVSLNGGTTWSRRNIGVQSVNGALPRACLIKPGSATEFYVGLDGGNANGRGVWRSTDGGGSWYDFNNGTMSNTYTIRALVFKSQGNPTLFTGAANATVAVAGRGVYEYSWLRGVVPQYYNYSNVGTGNNNFPFNVAGGKEVQWLFLANDLNQPIPCPAGQQITSLYFFMFGAGSGTFTNLTIKMGQADITSLPAGAIYTGPLDTVYYRASGALSSTSLIWMKIQLDRPFVYNPSRSLIVDVAQCATTASGMTVRQNLLSGNRRTYINNNGGCVYVYAGQDNNVLNFGVDVEPAPPPLCSIFARTWAPTARYPDLPADTYFQAAAWIGDTLFVHAPTNAGAAATTIYKYVRGGGWTSGVALPVAKVGGSLTRCGSKLYYIGGGTSSITAGSTDVYEFDPLTQLWTTKAPMPVALSAHGAVCWGDSVIFVIGGPYTGANTNLDIQVYRPASNAWSTIAASLPTGQGRRTLGLGISGNKIVISAGYNGVFLKSTFVGTINSAASISWAAAPDVPTIYAGLSRPGGVAYGDKFFLVCGERAVTGGYYDTTHVFSISGNAWIAIINNKPIKMSNIFNAVTARCVNDTVKIFVPGGYGSATGGLPGVAVRVLDVVDAGNLVGVSEPVSEVPDAFSLEQNYPNPFNPTTTLRYGLPRESHVVMKIYNVLGQEVITLRDEVQRAGTFEVVWDGVNASGARVASGVYFYRMEAKAVDRSAQFVSVKKMVVLK